MSTFTYDQFLWMEIEISSKTTQVFFGLFNVYNKNTSKFSSDFLKTLFDCAKNRVLYFVSHLWNIKIS
jgi:hypothetical protein